MEDRIYATISYRLSEIQHHYGPNYHILCDPFLMTHLARLCAEGTYQPAINDLITMIYQNLLKVIVNNEFPRKKAKINSRMIQYTARGVYEGEVIDPDVKAVSVNIARAGTVPAQICYDLLNRILNPRLIRQDHLIMNRTTDAEEQVTGASISGRKIGGPVADAIVLLPDPMGATGSSLIKVLDFYKNHIEGQARKYIAIHLIVTPEYLRAIKEKHPDLIVYAVRLDRGLSNEKILQSTPGEYWDEEVGLNNHQYIVPGGGGFGEILNNSYV
jgi:uracil phosphoribosyltransferase